MGISATDVLTFLAAATFFMACTLLWRLLKTEQLLKERDKEASDDVRGDGHRKLDEPR